MQKWLLYTRHIKAGTAYTCLQKNMSKDTQKTFQPVHLETGREEEREKKQHRQLQNVLRYTKLIKTKVSGKPSFNSSAR